ncbi:hypothetical protein [Nocardioides sp. HB32]
MRRVSVLLIGAVVALIAVGGAWLGGALSQGPGSGGNSTADQARLLAKADPVLDAGAFDGGLSLSTWLTFPDDRWVTGVDEMPLKIEGDPELWSVKYDDYDPKPDPFPVAAKTRFQVNVMVEAPQCDDPGLAPVVTVTSHTEDGTVRHDSYRPPTAQYLREVDHYCHLPPRVDVCGSHQSPDGDYTDETNNSDFTVSVCVSNPTDRAVVFKSQQYTYDGTTWEAASVTVQPHDGEVIRVPGHGNGCLHQNPWSTGHATLDGTPIRIPDEEAGPC